MSSHEQFEELIPLYVLGALSAAEQTELRAHLQECDACRGRYQQELALVQMLPRTVEPVQPSPATKAKLFARIDADLAQPAVPAAMERSSVGSSAVSLPRSAARSLPPRPARSAVPTPRRPWFRQPAYAFAALALLALVAVGGWLIAQNARSPEQQEIAQIVSDPNTTQHQLKGTPDMPNAWGILYSVPNDTRAVLEVGALESLPSDKAYEFWLIRGSDPVPAGVFTVNDKGEAQHLVKSSETISSFDTLGVSIEPRQGVQKPTGPIVLLGSQK